MITLPDRKICMNEQEAIQWLLDNFPIPFQCSANYAPDTEIGLGTIVNPTPAKVKVGSIIFFADSKVSTVIAVNANSFKCSEEYNDLVDDVVYVSNVQLNASGHLIITLSNGTDIDAGLIKQVSSFSINGSQHLIVTYNDGTSSDLGPIFSGNVTLYGDLTVDQDALINGTLTVNIVRASSLFGNSVTGDEIIEIMTGYAFHPSTKTNITITQVYAGIVKNGNKLTLVQFLSLERTGDVAGNYAQIGQFDMPLAVRNKLYPYTIAGEANTLDYRLLNAFNKSTASNVSLGCFCQKNSDGASVTLNKLDTLTLNTEYVLRVELTFLLSENLAA